MIKLSDVAIETFAPIFADTHTPVAFLVPTPTGYKKSIMDAISSVRSFLMETKIHNYEVQKQGPENKVNVKSYFVHPEHLEETKASLYRPKTKNGDPRIWFNNLKKYCSPYNLLALISIKKEIYILNLSNKQIQTSILNKEGFVYKIINNSSNENNTIANELLVKLQHIHNMGFLPSVTDGDAGVGDTLEYALGISRNNSELPDYKGIEIKASRLSKTKGKKIIKNKNRINLFAKVPDTGLKYSEIVKKYGHIVWDDKKNENRLSIQNTTFSTKKNSFGLILDVDYKNELINISHQDNTEKQTILSSWSLSTIKNKLLEKHKETFWVKAISEIRDGKEWFRYDIVIHTKNPNIALVLPLIESDKIMIDLAGYYKIKKENNKETMKWRDHGMLFKMWPNDLPLLFGNPKEYILDELSF